MKSRYRSLAASVLALSLLYLPVTGVSAPMAPLVQLHAAAPTDAPLQLQLSRPDWTYQLGQAATFHVRLALDPYPAQGVEIRYRLGPDMLEGPEHTAVVPREGLTLAAPAQSQPGFVRCLVTATIDGKPYEARATAAFSPFQIRPVQAEPADFDRYWDQQKQALAAIAPDWRLTPAPALSNSDVEVSYLSFQNIAQLPGNRPTRIYGVLSVPRAQRSGGYPAVLQVPGAGVRGYKGTPDFAAKGFITLQIGIHGIPVDLPEELYAQLNIGALESYNRFQLDNRDAYYYRRVYLGVLRALDYLIQHPRWNGKQLVAQGGSQGGQLAIMASALQPRVTGTVASYPAYSDVTGYLHGRAGGWPGLFRTDDNGQLQDQPVQAKVATSAYYDTVNFARRLRAPVLYYAGYNDMVTPPTSTLAVYNVISAPRQLVIEPEQVHLTSTAHRATIERWLLEHAAAK
ncbi:MAG: acetylxylan esterase [Duganella sp.]